MRLSAQTHIKNIVKKVLISFCILLLLTSFSTKNTYAQTQRVESSSSSQILDEFRTPDVEDNVPRNSHSYAQIVLIDVLSAVGCQLAGIDIVDETRPCLGYNPDSQKLTQVTIPDNTRPQLGGVLGFLSTQVGTLYHQPISSVEYINYMSSNFGLVEQTYATNQQPQNGGAICNGNVNNMGYGFCSMYPIMGIWQFVRNIAYALLVIAFVVLALGIMLRFKIDARNVMTLQNQIPRVIIAILLITFSYTLAGAMVDLMWTVTYMGMSMITSNSQTTMCDYTNNTTSPIDQSAQKHLVQTPMAYVNAIFSESCGGLPARGISKISNDTGGAVGDMITQLTFSFLGINYTRPPRCSLTSLGECIPAGIALIVSSIIKLIMLVTIIITLFRLWFNLLKTAVLFLVYTVMGPIYIVLGLLPGRPLGFENWLKHIFAYLLTFPVIAWMLTFAIILATEFKSKSDPNNLFLPPLVGNSNMDNFGSLIAFGLILLTPGMPDAIKAKLTPQGLGLGKQIRGGIAAGGSVIGEAGEAGWKRSWRRADPRTGMEAGAVRQFTYNRILGMGEKTMLGKPRKMRTDADGNIIGTRRYEWFAKAAGGTAGVSGEPRGRKK